MKKCTKKPSLNPTKHRKDKTAKINVDKVQEENIYRNVFPKQTIWFVHVITLFVRIYVVCQKENWWLLHPDEVYQSIEVAHSEVYGYGFRPYEYLPPPPEPVTAAEQQEAELGMFSLRSFLYPRIYMIWFHGLNSLGFRLNSFLAGKLLHCSVASHLPLAVFYFTLTFFSDVIPDKKRLKDLATLTCIMVATSEHLVILGTHSLVNSFLSPIAFLCLTLIFGHVAKLACSKPSDAVNETKKDACKPTPNIIKNGEVTKIEGDADERTPNKTMSNGHSTVNGHCIYEKSTKLLDQNSNYKLDYHQINLAKHETDTTRHLGRYRSDIKETLTLVAFGFLVGISFYIRIDLIILYSLSITMILVTYRIPIHIIFNICLRMAIGFASAIILGGFDDKLCYGYWFISPVQWFSFNILHGRSSILFGWQESSKYFYDIILYSSFTKVQTIIIILVVVYSCFSNNNINKFLFRKILGLNVLFIIMLTIYTFQKHKELRFLYNTIVIFNISASTSCFVLLAIMKSIVNRYIKLKYSVLYFILIILLTINAYVYYPGSKDGSNSQWTYMNVNDSNNINECLQYVGKQEDSTGLFLDRSIHHTAAYSVINKNIPIISRVHMDFYEFDTKSRFVTPSVDYFTHQRNVSVSVLNRVSNFFTKENFPYLLKHLITKMEYNYFVLPVTRKVNIAGFKQVFVSGSMKVIKRTNDRKSIEILIKHATRIPVGTNATVLDYEGSWLITYGLYEEAVIRLQAAISLDVHRVRPYQMLAILYKNQKNNIEMKQILERCYKNNGYDICSKLQPKVILHKDYTLNF